jgi:hypothetical protein
MRGFWHTGNPTAKSAPVCAFGGFKGRVGTNETSAKSAPVCAERRQRRARSGGLQGARWHEEKQSANGLQPGGDVCAVGRKGPRPGERSQGSTQILAGAAQPLACRDFTAPAIRNATPITIELVPAMAG